MSNAVEAARDLLREEVQRSSLRAVAARVGIDSSTLHTFVKPDGVKRPSAKVLEPILAYVQHRPGATGNIVAAPPGAVSYSDGMMAAAEHMSRTLTAIIAEARHLRESSAQNVTPTEPDAGVVGQAMLDHLDQLGAAATATLAHGTRKRETPHRKRGVG